MGGTGPSGVGKAYDMSQLDLLLQALAKGGEAVMREIMLPTRQMRRSTVRLRVHSDSGAWCAYVALYVSLHVSLCVSLYLAAVRLRVHSDSGAWCVSWGVSWGVS